MYKGFLKPILDVKRYNTVSLSSYIDILDQIEFVTIVQDSRFLKSIKCYQRSTFNLMDTLVQISGTNNTKQEPITSNFNGKDSESNDENLKFKESLLVKLFIKPDDISVKICDPNVDIGNDVNQQTNDNLSSYNETNHNGNSNSAMFTTLSNQRAVLNKIRGALPYSKFLETDRAIYLIRQYLGNNLYDRLSTRPFLEEIEKLWIAYQLLCIVSECHSKNQFHGDIKTENIVMTSWNSVYLTDFASYKPVYLPEDDNPDQFFFYFDTSQRRNCYLAPERFVPKTKNSDSINESIRYYDKSMQNMINEGDTETLAKMDIFSLGCVIAELYLDGGSIFTLSQIFKYKKKNYEPNLNHIENIHLKKLIKGMLNLDPLLRKSASEYLNEFKAILFPEIFYSFLHNFLEILDSPNINSFDNKVDKFYNEFRLVSKHLGIEYNIDIKEFNDIDYALIYKTNIASIPSDYAFYKNAKDSLETNNEVLILLDYVLSLLRNTETASRRVKAIELVVALSEYTTDECKLDRTLPFLICLLEDKNSEVCIIALRAITLLLSMVTSIHPLNSLLFLEFIFPKLKHYLLKCSIYEKINFAALLPYIAVCAMKFHEMAHILKFKVSTLSSNTTSKQNAINSNDISNELGLLSIENHKSKKEIINSVENFLILVLTDDENLRIALLKKIYLLCSVIGKQDANDLVLSHLITYLNNKNPYLRLAFVESIVPISLYVGSLSLEQYILPLLSQLLTDSEEIIILASIKDFQQLVKLNMLSTNYLWDICSQTCKFLTHPNDWIRQAVTLLIIEVASNISKADLFCSLYPIVRSYLEYDIIDFSWDTLHASIKKPISRKFYKLAGNWYRKSSKHSIFWKSSSNSKSVSTTSSASTPANPLSPSTSQKKSSLSIQLTNEDNFWIKKLKAMGLQENDLWKIYALRENIKSATSSYSFNLQQNNIVSDIKNLSALPRSLFLDMVFCENVIDGIKDPNSKMKSIPGFNNVEIDVNNCKNYKIINLNSLNHAKKKSDAASIFSTDTISSSLIASNEFSINARKNGLVVNLGAPPSVLTNQENIYGELNNTSIPLMLSNTMDNFEEFSSTKRRLVPVITSSYTGNNKSLLKFISNYNFLTSLDNFYEFGPPISNSDTNHTTYNAPKGNLVAHLKEHTGAVNCLVSSSDHTYFLSGGEDGLLKLWDSLRLERNVTSKSLFLVNMNSPVVQICFIENRDCFVVATKEEVKIFKVTFSLKRDYHKVKSLVQIRSFSLKKDSKKLNEEFFILDLKIANVENIPLLLIATSFSKIITLDIRSMESTFETQIPLKYGTVTTFAVINDSLMIVGTSKGYLSLWDLRFNLGLKVWKFQKGKMIRKIDSSFSNSKHILITILSDNNGIAIYELTKGNLQEIYKAPNSFTNSDVLVELANDGYSIHKNNHIGININDKVNTENNNIYDEYDDNELLSYMDNNKHIHDFQNLDDTDVDEINFNLDHDENFENLLETASNIISNRHSGLLSTFSTFKTNSKKNKRMYILSAELADYGLNFWNVVDDKESKQINKIYSQSAKQESSMISREQRQSIRVHNDVVTSITLLTKPYFMVVSGDRNGIINVYK